MPLDLDAEIAELETMSVAGLRGRYAELFGEAAPTRHRGRLVRRILWRLQAREEGDLSERARRRARQLADDARLRLTAPRPSREPLPRGGRKRDRRLPPPGSVITRLYKEQWIEVTVTPDGFLYHDRHYRSLSAVARAATGSHLKGFRFFRVAAGQPKEAS